MYISVLSIHFLVLIAAFITCCDRNSRTEADFKYYLSRELVNHIIYAVI